LDGGREGQRGEGYERKPDAEQGGEGHGSEVWRAAANPASPRGNCR